LSLTERVDPDAGVTERIEFVAGRRGHLYTWLGYPPDPRAVVVVCSPIFADFTANYQRERLLGRALMAHGLAAVRFHYWGEGNSDGDGREATFGSFCDDAETIAAHVIAELGTDQVAFVGTRMGALVAAAVAAPRPHAPLVLWEPVTQAKKFFASAFRARRMSELAQEEQGPKTSWRDQLARDGVVELLGYQVHPALVESLEPVDLNELLGDRDSLMYVAWFRDRPPGTRSELRLSGTREGIEEVTFHVAESWWFHDENATESGDLVDETVAWLVKALPLQSASE
jgi:alpha/beta superfamily hydrolase